jgi:hypothetical protein
MTNIVPFQPSKKRHPPSRPQSAKLSEADLRWLCAASQELRRLRDLTGESSPVGERLDQAYRALLTATVEIADLEGFTADRGEAGQRRLGQSRKGPIPPTPSNIRTALSYLSPDCNRETWVSIGMAVKDAIGDAGFDLFEAWSRDGESYRPADCRDAWKSIKAGGKTTVATLWRLALDAGWRPDGEAREETEAERQARERERAQRAEREAEASAKKARAAERKAAELSRIVTLAGADHPYLTRKGVKPTDTLFEIPAERLADVIGYTPKSDGEPLSGRVLVAFVERDGRPRDRRIYRCRRPEIRAGRRTEKR